MFSNRKLKKIVCSCLLIFGCLVPAVNGLAAVSGSIKISYHGRTDEETVVLSDTLFVLYRAGSWTDGAWELSEDFKGSGVSMENEDSSERKKQAERLYAYALAEQLKGTEQRTDEWGNAKFEDLEKGLYLAAQVGEIRKGDWIFRSSPFLVSIPVNENGTAVWDVVTEPKSEWTDMGSNGGSNGGTGGGTEGGTGGGSEGGTGGGSEGGTGGGSEGGTGGGTEGGTGGGTEGGTGGGTNGGTGGGFEGDTNGGSEDGAAEVFGDDTDSNFIKTGETEEAESLPFPEEIGEEVKTGKTPKTGDSSFLEFWLFLIVFSAAAAGVLYWKVIHIRNEDDA